MTTTTTTMVLCHQYFITRCIRSSSRYLIACRPRIVGNTIRRTIQNYNRAAVKYRMWSNLSLLYCVNISTNAEQAMRYFPRCFAHIRIEQLTTAWTNSRHLEVQFSNHTRVHTRMDRGNLEKRSSYLTPNPKHQGMTRCLCKTAINGT